MSKSSLKKSGLIEKELKYFLTKKDYETLLKSCYPHVERKIHQTNYYFDSNNLKLRKKRFGLRIRLLNKKKAILTLKFPAKKNPGPNIRSLKIRKEYEEPIQLKTAKAIIEKRKKVIELKSTPIKVLKKAFPKNHLDLILPLGAIETTRTIARFPNNLEFELDKFNIFGRSFYELEIETETPKLADKYVRCLFHLYDIPYHPISKSKLGRFLQLWKKSNRSRL